MQDQGRRQSCSPQGWQPWLPAAAPIVLAAWLTGCAEPAAPPAKPPIETRKTIRQTTQNVLELSQAVAAGGVPAEMSITSDGLDAVADAYRTSVGKLGAMAVEQKMRLYEAEHGAKPATYDEFMALIIAPGSPDPLWLPMLPYYQEWAYDPEAQGVVVIEFPAKKEQRQRETTGAAGF
jgi:hypothetical protein